MRSSCSSCLVTVGVGLLLVRKALGAPFMTYTPDARPTFAEVRVCGPVVLARPPTHCHQFSPLLQCHTHRRTCTRSASLLQMLVLPEHRHLSMWIISILVELLLLTDLLTVQARRKTLSIWWVQSHLFQRTPPWKVHRYLPVSGACENPPPDLWQRCVQVLDFSFGTRLAFAHRCRSKSGS